jgi:DNA-3-methyladenine glycosylase II
MLRLQDASPRDAARIETPWTDASTRALRAGSRHHWDMPARVPAPPPTGAPLTEETLAVAVDHLASLDPVLAASVARHGRPPLWAREPGFPTLVHIVLEQQVSLASARATFDRLRAVADPLTPAAFLTLDDRQLLEIGFSRQKTRYGRALAQAVADGRLDLDGLRVMDDDAVDASLTAVPGIGTWSATIYRLMVLGRPDAWPIHDIALAQAVAELRGLDRRPDAVQMASVADHWRPWRAVAARILWHHYLSERVARVGRARRNAERSTPGA